mmetsp:Transcript_2105/g.4825  ORF Transcript_2105/g.4825 Transcript_2105/m.4825 type:complete len:159 (+) Transcript_2105:3909-4385(+)
MVLVVMVVMVVLALVWLLLLLLLLRLRLLRLCVVIRALLALDRRLSRVMVAGMRMSSSAWGIIMGAIHRSLSPTSAEDATHSEGGRRGRGGEGGEARIQSKRRFSWSEKGNQTSFPPCRAAHANMLACHTGRFRMVTQLEVSEENFPLSSNIGKSRRK